MSVAEGTLNLFMRGVKLQFLHYPYTMLEQPAQWQGVRLSSVVDIACTKLVTISARGGKKDFIDLYMILQTTSLEDLFAKLDQKYQAMHYNAPHILKSLLYFADADEQPMPRMHVPLTWEEVKDFMTRVVKGFSL